MDDLVELEEHELALGGTRPPLMPFLNMPWIDCVILGLTGFGLFCQKPAMLVPWAFVFGFTIILYRKDYNAGRVFICWMKTSALHMGAHTFGGTFLSTRSDLSRPHFRGMIDAD